LLKIYPSESETSEFYVSVLLNRATGRNMIMYSTEGGMDIEEVAEHTPHLIFTEEIDPSVDFKVFKQEELLLI
jgi:succinyl-CoA synthetase beta subunit